MTTTHKTQDATAPYTDSQYVWILPNVPRGDYGVLDQHCDPPHQNNVSQIFLS